MSYFYIPQNTLKGNPLPTHSVFPGKMLSPTRCREVSCFLLFSAVVFSIGYTANSILRQNPTSSLTLDGRVSKISSDANTIHCPNWTSFSANFNGPDGEPYTIHCENGVFPFLMRKNSFKSVNIDYSNCVEEGARSSELDIGCVSELLLQKGEDDTILPIADVVDDIVKNFDVGPGCTDDDMLHASPCSEIYPNDPRDALRGAKKSTTTSQNIDTIMCHIESSFSKTFKGIDGYPYSVYCNDGEFPLLVRTDIPHKVNLNYRDCITSMNDGAQLDLACLDTLIFVKGGDDEVDDDTISYPNLRHS